MGESQDDPALRARQMAPVHFVGADEDVIVAGGADALEGGVDPGLAGDEGGERRVVGSSGLIPTFETLGFELR
jgi:hypothetical protein